MKRPALTLLALVLLVLLAPGAGRSEGSLPDDGLEIPIDLPPFLPPPPPPPIPLDIPDDSLVPADPVGYMDGSSAVTPTGEYTYTVPIAVPPGRAGMEPSLALTYSSHGGDGLAGVGWSLAGLSEIRRCGRSLAIDGEVDGIDFDNTDRFCLDGQRLVAISGAYGLTGTEYRAERDPFARILSYGGAPDSPDSFEVRRKDGRIARYEAITAPRVEVSPAWPNDLVLAGDVVLRWVLTELRDRSGNVIRYRYDVARDDAAPWAVEILPDEIEYTGRDGEEGLRKVRFSYEDREDPTFAYEAGVRVRMTRRLSAIHLHAPRPVLPMTVGAYHLDYQQSPVTGRSLLQRVARCDASIAGCLWGRRFTWAEDPRPDMEVLEVGGDEFPPTHFTLELQANMHVFDADGDGRDDLLYRVGDRIYVRTSAPGAPLGQRIDVTASGSGFADMDLGQTRPADAEGDGVTEILGALKSSAYGFGYRSFRWSAAAGKFQPAGPMIPVTFDSSNGVLDAAQLTDLDGDGRLDLLLQELANGHLDWSIRMNTGQGFGPSQPTGLRAPCGRAARAGDIDGDGRGDLLGAQPGCQHSVALGLDDAGAVAIDPGVDLGHSAESAVLADLNGDGLRDAVWPEIPTFVRWNTGNGFAPIETYDGGPDRARGLSPDADGGTRVADVDGDGREDIIAFRDIPEPAILVHLARGPAGFAPAVNISGEPGTLHSLDGWLTSQAGDFNGDGLVDLVLIHQGRLRVLQQRPAQSDVVTEVWDDVPSQGPRERVTYSRAWSDAPRAVTCAYPQRCLRHGLLVVREHSVSQGEAISWPYRREYSYEDPRVDLRGRGFLGFGEVRVWDAARSSRTVTTYDHETAVDGIYPYAGLPQRILHIAPILPPSGPLPPAFKARATEVTRTYELRRLHQDLAYFVPLARWQSKEWEEAARFEAPSIRLLESPNVTVLRSRSGSETHDDLGNLLSSVEETQGGVRRELSIEYNNYQGPWLIGLARRVETRSFQVGTTPPEPRRAAMQFDDLGRLWKVGVEPIAGTDPDLQSFAAVTRSLDGLITSIAMKAPGVPERRVYIAHDARERMFPEVIWNDLGHAAWQVHHPALGEVVRAVDMNGVETRRWLDGFGRLRRVRQDGAGEVDIWHEERAENGRVTGVLERMLAEDGGESVTAYDELGRAVEEAARSFSGEWSVRAVAYDQLGRVSRVHRPSIGGPGPATRIEHDSLDRVLEVIEPNGARTSWAHAMFETWRLDPRGHDHVVRRDIDDRVVESADWIDGQEEKTSYRYGAFDLVEEVEDADHNVTAIGHDHLGRKIWLDDPDRGLTLYEYNGLSELRQETDALGVVTAYSRDALGRLVQQVDADGTSTFEWDQGPNAIGQLSMAVSPDGTVTDLRYDPLGRLISTVTTVDGNGYEVGRSYDALGRLSTLHYPAVPGRADFVVEHCYNAWGYLEELRDVTAGAERMLWTVESREADGALGVSVFGNDVRSIRTYHPLTGRISGVQAIWAGGSDWSSWDWLYSMEYTHDLNGNVQTRTDVIAGRAESFGYDEVDRLRRWTLDAGGPTREMRYDVDAIGNLWQTRLDGQVLESFGHGANGKPHALTSAAGASYTYDARGRMFQGGGRQISYTSFDLPRAITRGGETTTFSYDAFGRRARKSGPGGTTVYVGDLYERREDAATGAVAHVFTVRGEEGPVAQVIHEEATQAERTRYLVTDALGSVGVVTDDSGAEVERVYFEPFGKRIEADGTPLATGAGSGAGAGSGDVKLGFTGHRHDDELGLIDMRGRVYDPALRRFLTPDPLVSDPLSGQAYNRYAYARGNPLRYVDPSGYDPQPLWGPAPDVRSGTPGFGVGVSFDFSQKAINKGQRGGGGGGSSHGGEATPKPARSDSAGHEPPTGATTRPSETPGGNAEGGGIETVMPGGGGSDGADAGDDSGASLETRSWKDSAVVQGVGGFLAGLGVGLVPGAGPTSDDLIKQKVLAEGTREARIGKALGEIVGGLALTIGGLTGKVAGLVMSATGVGALAGVPAIAVSAIAVVGGGANVGAGIRGLSEALSTGGSAPVARLRPEAKYLGTGKHGIGWKEGRATAKSLGKPQGQWGSKADLDYAGDKAATLKPGEGGWFELPNGHSSVVHNPDGKTVAANRFWVRNNGSGTFHGYPAE